MKKKKFLINCMCYLALAVGTGGVSTMASDLNVEFTADEGNAVDDTDISAFSEGEEIGDDATQPQDIGIVEDEIKAFETEISLRENEDIPKNFDSNYSKTCYAIQSLERLIEIMKEYQ